MVSTQYYPCTSKLSMSSPLESASAYLNQPTCGVGALCKAYREAVQDMLVKFQEHVYSHNDVYLRYVVLTGLRTMTRVFQMIFLYTNDLQLTMGQTLRANSYFVEFVGQLGEDHHTFLRLDSRDASLFVYKKTIFCINDDIRKAFAEGTTSCDYANRLSMLSEYIECIIERLISCGHGDSIAGNFIGLSRSLERGTVLVETMISGESTAFALDSVRYLSQVAKVVPGKFTERLPLLDTLARRMRKTGVVFSEAKLESLRLSDKFQTRDGSDSQRFNDWLARALQ